MASLLKETKLFPPMYFAYVEVGLYRSAFPNETNIAFLKTLCLHSILVLDDDCHVLEEFASLNGINIIFVQNINAPSQQSSSSSPNWSPIPEEMVLRSLTVLSDSNHYPLLVTCKTGRNFTGVIIGCLRKKMGWSFMSLLEEFRRFSGSRQQQHEQFIEMFDTDLLLISTSSPPFLLRSPSAMFLSSVIPAPIGRSTPVPLSPVVIAKER